jgi:hypothetical protein
VNGYTHLLKHIVILVIAALLLLLIIVMIGPHIV